MVHLERALRDFNAKGALAALSPVDGCAGCSRRVYASRREDVVERHQQYDGDALVVVVEVRISIARLESDA